MMALMISSASQGCVSSYLACSLSHFIALARDSGGKPFS